jgi:hypothetical protein
VTIVYCITVAGRYCGCFLGCCDPLFRAKTLAPFGALLYLVIREYWVQRLPLPLSLIYIKHSSTQFVQPCGPSECDGFAIEVLRRYRNRLWRLRKVWMGAED